MSKNNHKKRKKKGAIVYIIGLSLILLSNIFTLSELGGVKHIGFWLFVILGFVVGFPIRHKFEIGSWLGPWKRESNCRKSEGNKMNNEEKSPSWAVCLRCPVFYRGLLQLLLLKTRNLILSLSLFKLKIQLRYVKWRYRRLLKKLMERDC